MIKKNSSLFHSYNQLIQFDLLYQLQIDNRIKLPDIQKIIIHMSIFTKDIDNKKKIIPILLLLQLITTQKMLLTKSKKHNLKLKIKKGMLIGGKIDLQKNNKFLFLENLLFFSLIKQEYFQGLENPKLKNNFQFQIQNNLHFVGLKNEFLRFSTLPSLDVNFIVKNNSSLSLFFYHFNDYFIKRENIKYFCFSLKKNKNIKSFSKY